MTPAIRPIEDFAERFALTRHHVDEITASLAAASHELFALLCDFRSDPEMNSQDAKEFAEDLDCHREWAQQHVAAMRDNVTVGDSGSDIVDTFVAWQRAWDEFAELQAVLEGVLRPTWPA